MTFAFTQRANANSFRCSSSQNRTRLRWASILSFGTTSLASTFELEKSNIRDIDSLIRIMQALRRRKVRSARNALAVIPHLLPCSSSQNRTRLRWASILSWSTTLKEVFFG